MTKVLVIEDSKMFAKILSSRLSQELGVEVHVGRTLKETKQLVAKNRAGYFVALLDMELPDAQRGEVVDYCIAQKIPSVVFTGKFDESIRSEILNKGVVDYILKNNVNCVYEVLNTVQRLLHNRQIKILVVDDSRTSLEFAQKALQIYQFRVLCTTQANQVLQILKEHPEIKLIITDYAMPDLDGFRLTDILRKQYQKNELAIIGISASDDSSLSAKFLKHGANDFLSKPFTPEELYCRVIHNLELNELISKLKQLNDMKDRFLGMAAHDLRSPIGAIKGFIELLLDSTMGPINTEQSEFLNMIDVSCQNMLDLINDLLDVTAIEQGKIEIKRTQGSLDLLVMDRIRLHEVLARKKQIRIHHSLKSITNAYFDPQRLSQVVDNLLSNAIKFSPPGKEIFVCLDRRYQQAELRVIDQGPGITPDEQDALFKEFFKGRARPTGDEGSTGLGLAIVKKIVQAHQGSIEVKSTPGKGSEFIIRIPCT